MAALVLPWSSDKNRVIDSAARMRNMEITANVRRSSEIGNNKAVFRINRKKPFLGNAVQVGMKGLIPVRGSE